MPDQALFRISGKNTADNHIRALKLLIAADDLVFAVLFIGGKHGEKLEDVHHLFRLDHIFHADLHIRKAALRFMGGGVPRPPHIDRHMNGTVAVALPLCGKIEYVCDKHGGNAFFIRGNISSGVKPRNSTADRCLQFANRNGKAVDQQHNIQTFAPIRLRIYPLVGDNIFV